MLGTAWRIRNLSIMGYAALVHVVLHTYDILTHHHRGTL